MSLQHHGDGERSELVRRFQDQNGRTGADDDGQLTYAIATDEKHRTIVIRFPHPTEWIGLDIESAEELRDQLTERLLFLRGIRDAAENVDATLEKLKAAEARQRDVFRRQESDE